MRSFLVAALVGTYAAASPVLEGDVPTCQVVNGHTIVNYTPSFHPSFKCAHTGATCACTVHPTHSTGGCKEIEHTNGVSVQHAGDCTDSGKDVATCLSAQTGTTSMTLTGFDGTKNLAGKNNLDFVHLEGDKYMIKDGTKCLIFGGSGNNKNPQFYNWGGSDEHCGFPDQGGGSKASLLANGQAIFDVIHLEDDKYLIKYAEDGPGGGGKCLIYGNSGKDTSVQRYLWNANAAYADTCGFSTVALVVANRQAVFTLNC